MENSICGAISSTMKSMQSLLQISDTFRKHLDTRRFPIHYPLIWNATAKAPKLQLGWQITQLMLYKSRHTNAWPPQGSIVYILVVLITTHDTSSTMYSAYSSRDILYYINTAIRYNIKIIDWLGDQYYLLTMALVKRMGYFRQQMNNQFLKLLCWKQDTYPSLKDRTDFDKEIVIAIQVGHSFSKMAGLLGCSRYAAISTY